MSSKQPQAPFTICTPKRSVAFTLNCLDQTYPLCNTEKTPDLLYVRAKPNPLLHSHYHFPELPPLKCFSACMCVGHIPSFLQQGFLAAYCFLFLVNVLPPSGLRQERRIINIALFNIISTFYNATLHSFPGTVTDLLYFIIHSNSFYSSPVFPSQKVTHLPFDRAGWGTPLSLQVLNVHKSDPHPPSCYVQPPHHLYCLSCLHQACCANPPQQVLSGSPVTFHEVRTSFPFVSSWKVP